MRVGTTDLQKEGLMVQESKDIAAGVKRLDTWRCIADQSLQEGPECTI